MNSDRAKIALGLQATVELGLPMSHLCERLPESHRMVPARGEKGGGGWVAAAACPAGNEAWHLRYQEVVLGNVSKVCPLPRRWPQATPLFSLGRSSLI